MHDYRHTAPEVEQHRDWRRLAPGLVLALVMVAGSAVSLAYLAEQWRVQAPVRAARESARLAREAAERALPVAVAPTPKTRPVGETVAPTSLAYRSVEWLSEPTYTISRTELAPGFHDRRLEVEFRCTAGIDGRLHDCKATERPAGSGLARAILPQLDRVRLRPMQVGDEYQEVPVGFSLEFDFRPKPGTQTPSIPTGVPPAEASAPPSEPFTDPDPVEPEPPAA
ncbi:hypothetical protein [Brevundimonas sp. Root1279]|uniref:hypothetical protein n=1 Tax=Brevundimonas sp. Root1279 TaxID=1736443 RepID=UPI0012E344A7|nr:hypothetical protein [Brevundimonas sp. Root1279]